MRNILTLLLVSSFALAGCTSATVGTTPAPAPTSTMSVATQRLEAQTAIAVAQGIHAATLLTAALGDIQGVLSGTVPPPDGTCKNGVEKTVVVTGPESIKATVDVFYDLACTQKLSQSTLTADLTIGTNPLYTVAIAGKATIYNARGRHVGYGAIANTTTVSSSERHEVGFDRHDLEQTKRKRHRDVLRSFVHVLDHEHVRLRRRGAGVVVAGTRRLGHHQGFYRQRNRERRHRCRSTVTPALPGGLTLAQGSGDKWTIGGGTLRRRPKGTFGETVDAKSLNVDGKLALQDAGSNAAVTLSFGTRTGIKNGDVSSIFRPKGYSTFSTDETGTGAIAYSARTGRRASCSSSSRADV